MLLGKKIIKCPYCYKALEKIPKRKIKCPFCESQIYIRNQILVTEEKSKIIDALKLFNYSEDQYERHEKALLKRTGIMPNYFDVIVQIFNNESDKNYYAMATFMNQEGKEFFNFLQLSNLKQLKEFQSMGIEKVEIVSGEGCSSCRELNGKVLMVENAIKNMPIPNKNCTNSFSGGKEGFCTCMYVAN